MISAFGVDHGHIAKFAVGGEYGWDSKEAKKRTMKTVNRDSRMKAGHGNKQRLAASSAVGGGIGAGVGAIEGGILGGKRGAAIGAGVGTGVGGGFGALTGKAENQQRAAHRELPGALKRKDIRRVKPGERTTAFEQRIVKE